MNKTNHNGTFLRSTATSVSENFTHKTSRHREVTSDAWKSCLKASENPIPNSDLKIAHLDSSHDSDAEADRVGAILELSSFTYPQLLSVAWTYI